MRIEAFLRESPLFAVTSTARHFESLTTRVLEEVDLSFLEALVLAAIFFEAPRPVRPSSLAETFGTTRGNVSHCVSSLEAKGLLHRKIDPEDARAYRLTLKPQGKNVAVQVIGALDRLSIRDLLMLSIHLDHVLRSLPGAERYIRDEPTSTRCD
jgi:DNA-binding MarR family transcriptional regulator